MMIQNKICTIHILFLWLKYVMSLTLFDAVVCSKQVLVNNTYIKTQEAIEVDSILHLSAFYGSYPP